MEIPQCKHSWAQTHTSALKSWHSFSQNTQKCHYKGFPVALRNAALLNAHCPLSNVGPRTKELWPTLAVGGQCAGSPARTPIHRLDATLGASTMLPSPAPWLAPLFPRPIRLSAKTFDMRHNMVPVFSNTCSRFQHGFSISRLLSTPTTAASWCLHTWEMGSSKDIPVVTTSSEKPLSCFLSSEKKTRYIKKPLCVGL